MEIAEEVFVKAYIVCGGSAGRAVLFGRSESEPCPGQPFRLAGARMVLRWDAACGGLLGLAARGPKGDTKITAPVEMLADKEVHQVFAVSDESAAAIDAWAAA